MDANDAVTVASMTRPKPLPNEALSDLAVSAATKLRCYRVFLFSLPFKCSNFLLILSKILNFEFLIMLLLQHLSKYFKQSAKALEQQIAREARFYGALIR